MDDQTATQPVVRRAAKKKASKRPKALWMKVREPLARSRFAKGFVTALFVHGLRFIRLTNPTVADSHKFNEDIEPGIIAMWHGQHLLTPTFYPSKRKLIAMVSKSADAELNAMVLEKFGIGAVRGSGGRDGSRHVDKGGARALVALKKALDIGNNVAMIADIPHGTPREAGMGVILLARLSGRPILGIAIATSRRKVFERSWDKTTIGLPFGRSAVMTAEPIYVAKDADEAEMERKRQELTETLNAITAKAYALVDGAR
jgi:lysophospholipid acyltransferase (LPLAT)-like uncharacterized protein